VTDHRVGLTLYDLGNIMNGDIQKIVDELALVNNMENSKKRNKRGF
jgi:peptide chain release factor 1